MPAKLIRNELTAKIPPDKSVFESLSQAYRELSPYLNIGYVFVASVVLLAFAGRYLDARWGTDPWLTLTGALLGIAVGFYQFFKIVLKSPPKDSKK